LWTLLAPLTQIKYHNGLQAITDWSHGVAVDFWALDVETQDLVLADFCLEHLEDGSPPQFVVECVAAASKRYLNRRVYRAAAKLVTGWKSTLPSNEAHPMPEDAAFGMVVLSVLIGQFDLAFVILMCFCGLLRIGECLALQPIHITLGVYATGAE
jgi:hypothetical protein